MMPRFTRRELLSAAGAAALSGALPRGAVASAPRRLICESRILDVDGRAAKVFGLAQSGGTQGLVLDPDERFAVTLVNRLAEKTLVHWHGQIPPNAQDGVPGVTQLALKPGSEYAYDFQPVAGSHWMHSHVGLQRQKLLSAPLIVRTRDDLKADLQEHVMFLHDFTFRAPEDILAELMAGEGHGDMPGMNHGAGGHMQGHAGHGIAEMPGHLNDVEHDAFLANDRTLADPEIVRVERGGRVRLRIVNGAAATNFQIDLGHLEGVVVATDGNPVHPAAMKGHLPIAMAQRLDILIQLPNEEGAWPVLAVREGDPQQTGLVFATRNATVRKISSLGHSSGMHVDTRLERALRAVAQLPQRDTAKRVRLRLTGGMSPYRWGFDGKKWGEHTPIRLVQGERVEMTFENETDMAHPVHIHGHHFKVVAVNDTALDGPFRDTVLVPFMGKVTVAFDAGAPGRWVMHCHNAYHMAPGMMTEIVI